MGVSREKVQPLEPKIKAKMAAAMLGREGVEAGRQMLCSFISPLL